MDSEGVIPEGVFSVEHNSVFCAMKEKIEGVKEGPFDVRVVE